jgi:septum formation protein
VSLTSDKKEILFAETTRVRFHKLRPGEIEHYINNYRPFDKAGAYAIQEWIGVTGIHSIEGDFYNVMGLPVSRVLQELKSF